MNRIALILMAALMLTGAAPAEIHRHFVAVRMQANAFEPPVEVGTAAPGDLLWTQDFSGVSFARLNTSFTASHALTGSTSVSNNISQDALLFEVVSQTLSGRAFCSVELTAHISRASSSNDERSCLLDYDNDGRFEVVSILFGDGRRVGIGFGGTLLHHWPLETPVAYSAVEAQAPASPFAVRYHSDRLTLVAVTDGEPALLPNTLRAGRFLESDAFVRLPPARRLPTTIELAGARVEILAIERRILHYRILSGFPSGQVTCVSLNALQANMFFGTARSC